MSASRYRGDFMTAIRPRRSVLYMPGSNARALEKARTLAGRRADPRPGRRGGARRQGAGAAAGLRRGEGEGLRQARDHHPRQRPCDALGRGRSRRRRGREAGRDPGAEDFRAQRPARRSRSISCACMPTASIAVWAMVETPLAILNIGAIAAAGGRLACFVMGTNDLIKEIRGAAHAGSRQPRGGARACRCWRRAPTASR